MMIPVTVRHDLCMYHIHMNFGLLIPRTSYNIISKTSPQSSPKNVSMALNLFFHRIYIHFCFDLKINILLIKL